MSSGLKKLPIIGVAGFILIGLATNLKPSYDEIITERFLNMRDNPEIKASFPEDKWKPKSLRDSLQEMANLLGKRIYEYIVEIEVIPENYIFQINKSGYQQYEITSKGEKYSIRWVKFYTDRIMTTAEAYQFAERYPERCIPIIPTPEEKSRLDRYNMELDEYQADPEDEINFVPEIFDFLAD